MSGGDGTNDGYAQCSCGRLIVVRVLTYWPPSVPSLQPVGQPSVVPVGAAQIRPRPPMQPNLPPPSMGPSLPQVPPPPAAPPPEVAMPEVAAPTVVVEDEEENAASQKRSSSRVGSCARCALEGLKKRNGRFLCKTCTNIWYDEGKLADWGYAPPKTESTVVPPASDCTPEEQKASGRSCGGSASGSRGGRRRREHSRSIRRRRSRSRSAQRPGRR